ncbi:MAG: DMT family transporter [Pseudomonadota bacterium]
MTDTVRAALWMLGATLSFSAMAVAGRVALDELDTFEIMFYRSLVGILLVSGTLTLMGRWAEVTPRAMPVHILRNACHFAGQNLWFFALPLIPLAQLFALEFTTPLWVILLAALFLGENLTRIRVLTALVGFVGVLIVARPGAVPVSIGTITALLSAVAFAGSYIATKALTRVASVGCILFWLTVIQAGFGLVATGYDGDIHWPSAGTWTPLVVIAICGLSAHLCITTALTLAPASIVAPIDFVRLPLIAVVGLALYQEPIDAFVLLGAAIIFGANYTNILKESKSRPRDATEL